MAKNTVTVKVEGLAEVSALIGELKQENERLRWLVGWAVEGIPDEDDFLIDAGGIEHGPEYGNPWEWTLDEVLQRRWDESDPDDDGAQADCHAVVALLAECRQQHEDRQETP